MTQQLDGALIGYGYIAERGHAPTYRRRSQEPGDVRIVAVADGCAERRQQAAADLPGVRLYRNHRELLAAEARRLHFVDIATPPCDHAEIAIDALEEGLHVLCEKPLATTLAAATQMLRAARRNQRVLMPCHTYKYAPVVQAVRRWLDGGHIGRVHLVTMQTFRNTHARGVPQWRPDWRREKAISGGGIAMDHGSHTFYLALDWLGGLPTSVTAKMATHGHWDTEDALSCTVDFPQGQLVAHLTWTAGMRRVCYTVHGEHGAISVDDDDLTVTLLDAARPVPGGNGALKPEVLRESHASAWHDAGHPGWFEPLLDQFRAAIVAGTPVGAEARAAWHCIQLIETAYASSGRASVALGLGPLAALHESEAHDAQEPPCQTGLIPLSY